MTVAKKAELNTNTTVTKGKGMAFLSRGKLRNGMNTVFVTVFTSAILAIFLMPFLYMTMTSLKTKAQITVLGSPIYPAKIPTFVFSILSQGEVLTVDDFPDPVFQPRRPLLQLRIDRRCF